MAALYCDCDVERMLFLEIAVIKALETGTVAGFILGHFMDCVMYGVEVLCLGEFCDTELVFAGAAFSFDPLFKVGLGVPYHFSEKFGEFCSMLSLFESISLECLGDFRIAFPVSLAAHGKVHSDFGACTVEMVVKAFKDNRVDTLCDSEPVLVGPGFRAFGFDYFNELVCLGVAYMAFCRRGLSFV